MRAEEPTKGGARAYHLDIAGKRGRTVEGIPEFLMKHQLLEKVLTSHAFILPVF